MYRHIYKDKLIDRSPQCFVTLTIDYSSDPIYSVSPKVKVEPMISVSYVDEEYPENDDVNPSFE